MKKWTWLIGLLVLLGGCGFPAEKNTVSVDGSTAMAGVLEVLQEAFAERHPEIRINCSGSGSGAGVEAVLAGTCDIGASSRELTEEEIKRGAIGRVAAWDGIAVIVHPDNPVRDLSREALAGIFTGKVRRWTEAGGEDRPVAVYGREAGSGTRTAFEKALDISGRCVYINEYCSAGDVVGNVAGNPNAIGYTSWSAVNDTTAAVRVDGMEFGDEDYPLQRPFLLVTKADAVLSEAAGSFLDFALSAGADPYLRLAGVIPPERGDAP